MNNPPSRANRRQTGFTLVELLVVIAIIGMLMALLIPAVGAARARARQITCTNQLKQLATGIINYESSKQKYPGYVQSLKRSDGASFLRIRVQTLSNSLFESTSNRAESLVSWAAMILPEIEGNDIYDAMFDATTTGPRAQILPLEVFRCPDDTEMSALSDTAGLTYVANTGTWDWYGTNNQPLPSSSNFGAAEYNAIAGDTKSNGIFHNRTFDNVSLNMSDVSSGDGASNTLLLSENIHKEIEEPESSNLRLYTWAGVFPGTPGEQQLGMVWIDPEQYDSGNLNANPFVEVSGVPIQYAFSQEGDAVGYPIASPVFARPASSHPGGAFNAAFADGSTRTFQPDLDYTVYQRLLTVKGRKATEPVGGTDSIYKNLAPLSADDF
ncbi:Type II secretion system protein G precursor [Planctomycetes bacterium MalM25]|nr:Type II secretion system protein G precursor [Planctomycetes bacterium MalM25]